MYFQFEEDFVQSLRCIPMVVRFKLDTVGVKLRLLDWQQLSRKQREALVSQPCITPEEQEGYRSLIQRWVMESTGILPATQDIKDNPPWLEDSLPLILQQQFLQKDVMLTAHSWETLMPLQRFVLIKLLRSGHEHHNLARALQEFGLS